MSLTLYINEEIATLTLAMTAIRSHCEDGALNLYSISNYHNKVECSGRSNPRYLLRLIELLPGKCHNHLLYYSI